FNMNNGSIQADAGTYISYIGSAINGGFLRGAGTHLLTNNSSVSGVTIVSGTKVEQSQTFNASNLTNSGTLTNTSGLFTWDGGVNTASGTLNVNLAVQTTNFENDGVINVNNSFSNYGSNMVSGGGSRINIAPSADFDLATTELDLNGGMLDNEGSLAGTVNVH